jgi:hypothetical protein
LVYLDDILVFFKNEDEHVSHLDVQDGEVLGLAWGGGGSKLLRWRNNLAYLVRVASKSKATPNQADATYDNMMM